MNGKFKVWDKSNKTFVDISSNNSCTMSEKKRIGLVFWNKEASNWLVDFGGESNCFGLHDIASIFKPEIIGSKFSNPELLGNG